jgi:vitamin B12/bleomycin/antimicrobial peptide transport system ATP-binding/permease protein
MDRVDDQHTKQYLLTRYREAALGFWRQDARRTAWFLTVAVFTLAVVNLGLGLLMNVWHRIMFDALDNRDGTTVLSQSIIFFPLVVASLAMAIANTYSKMSLQREWRTWLNGHVLDRWLARGRYYQLNLRPGDHSTPEYRVAEDLRLSVDAPVDIVLGIFAAVISAITYIGVLWYIGGDLEIPIGSTTLRIPGFLVIAAFVYAVVASGAMVRIARGFVVVAEKKNQAEADYRYALTRLRENGESIALLGGDAEERAGLGAAFERVRNGWRAMMMQTLRTTIVAHTTNGLAGIIPLLLCAPKYVTGTMTLGEMMQASAAFVTVQHSFNWLVENYPRLADWTTSACRLASLLVSLDRLDGAGGEDANARIVRKPAEDGALRLRDLSVTLDDGTTVVNEADIEIAPGEKVLVVGESGTGKSTLVRAIAGLWPWGEGEVRINADGLSLMPQRPYVPLGTLRRAVTYPISPEAVEDAVVRKSVEDVGLGHLLDKLDQDERWDHVLSGGEKQRLGFARILIQKPNVIVMDEATAALDPVSQERLMRLILERLPAATLVSVAHRVELEAFHTRKLVLERQLEGARLVGDQLLHKTFSRRRASCSGDQVRHVRRAPAARVFARSGATRARRFTVRPVEPKTTSAIPPIPPPDTPEVPRVSWAEESAA